MDDAIEFFIDVTYARMQKVDFLLDKYKGADKILPVGFESLVEKYDGAKERIEEFLGFDSKDHLNLGKYFNPQWSEKNINIYKNSGLEIKNNKFEKLLNWYNERNKQDSV